MPSLARLVGKAATGAAPVLYQNWRDQVQKEKDANLQAYRSGEAQKNRDQDQAQHEDRMAADKDRLDVTAEQTDRRLTLSEEQLGMAKKEQVKALDLLDKKIESASIDNKNKSKISDLRSQLINVDPSDTESASKIMTDLKAMGVDLSGSANWKYFKVADKFGDEQLVQANPATGNVRKSEIDSSPRSNARSGPQPGDVADGYKFKGGDPANPDNWEKQ